MGYEINYSEKDYAAAAHGCARAAEALHRVQQLLASTRGRILLSAAEARLTAAQAGLAPPLVHLTQLAELVQQGTVAANDAQGNAGELGTRVRQAMDNARAAEHRVVTLLALLSSPRTITEFVGEWWSTRGSPPRDSTERMLELLGALLRAPLDPFNQPDPHQRQVDEFLEDLTRVLDGNQQLPVQPIRIRHSEALPPLELDGGLEGYYRLQAEVLRQESRILVGKTLQDGEETFVVILPGTHGELGEQNPFDARGILDSLGQDSGNYIPPVLQALRQSGAREGSRIIFSGHSQGGVHAVNLAKNPLIGQKFKVQAVLTLGAPIGNVQLPQQIMALHVEDASDPVPGLDGRANRRRPRQLTVTFRGPENPGVLPKGTFGPGHTLQNYGNHLRQLQRQPARDLSPVLRGLRFEPGPMQLRGFTLRRIPPERPKTPTRRDENYRKLGQIAPPR